MLIYSKQPTMTVPAVMKKGMSGQMIVEQDRPSHTQRGREGERGRLQMLAVLLEVPISDERKWSDQYHNYHH